MPANTFNKKTESIFISIVIIIAIAVCILILYVSKNIEDNKLNIVHASKTIFVDEMIKVKTEVKDNKLLGKINYDKFRKYNLEKYVYGHSLKSLIYLRKSAHEGYYKSEYIYGKYILSSINLKNIFISKNNKYIKYTNTKTYAKAIEFIKLSSKQNYAPALFQMAMLYKNGALIGYDYYIKLRNFYDDKSKLFYFTNYKNEDKIKKMLYLSASKGYKPAINEVDKLYNSKIK